MFKSLWLSVAYFACIGILFRTLSTISPLFVLECYSCVAGMLLWLVISYYTWPLVKQKLMNGRVESKNKAVLITGCDSGFGHMLAKRLDSKGYHVFATCLFPSGDGAEELRKTCSNRLQVLYLDVTKDEIVKQAVQFVRDNLGTSDLWAVVNNAGIAKGFFGELTPMKDYIMVADVNTFGMVRVTKAFLPLIRRSKGRIVNVASLAGRICFRNFTPYAMSKHAAVAFNDCLRREMIPWGVRVISIEPEGFRTEISSSSIIGNNYDDIISTLDETIRADYGEGYLKKYKYFLQQYPKWCSPKLYKVIHALEHAICSKHPEIRYVPTRDLFARIILYALECLPASLIDAFFIVMSFILRAPKLKTA